MTLTLNKGFWSPSGSSGPTADITATGATETTYEDGGTTYFVQTWTSSGSFVVGADATMEILVIAGGGHSPAWNAMDAGGGGGAGGFKYFYQKTLPAATYTVTVGGQGNNSDITDGASLTLESTRGGKSVYNKGAPFNWTQATRDGGSGAGGYVGTPPGGGVWGVGQGIANQGNDGGEGWNGAGYGPSNYSHGGGGGAKTVGGNATSLSQAGNGGQGYTEGTDSVYDWQAANGSTQVFKINGTGGGYAGGGGASTSATAGHAVGTGTQGGGSGSKQNGTAGIDATDGTGGGAGGGDTTRAVQGGSGVVIIRYV